MWMRVTRRNGCRSAVRMCRSYSRRRTRARRWRMKNVRRGGISNRANVRTWWRRWHLLPPSSSSVAEPNLYPFFFELSSLCQFLACINIRILRPLESSFQIVQLIGCESCSASSLLSFQLNSGLAVALGSGACFVWN